MTDGMLGFIGGIVAALIGAILAGIIHRTNEHRKEKNAARHVVYMLLLELQQQYFWVASAEATNDEPPKEMLDTCRKTAWTIADKLRSFDRVEHLDEILTVLFSSSVPTATERANRLDALLDRYGELVNPAYAQAIKKISRDNVIGQAQRGTMKTNAPGAAYHYY
ncbi:hypothetical protein [Pseudomonas juntendi]|uniref:hypothetical protein n=1 Tax=Pseudomonas juntendi TaxID=2666183 RepID=UPI001F3B384F|nr:hypothetical protein [Pseudomonas juntendi]